MWSSAQFDHWDCEGANKSVQYTVSSPFLSAVCCLAKIVPYFLGLSGSLNILEQRLIPWHRSMLRVQSVRLAFLFLPGVCIRDHPWEDIDMMLANGSDICRTRLLLRTYKVKEGLLLSFRAVMFECMRDLLFNWLSSLHPLWCVERFSLI